MQLREGRSDKVPHERRVAKTHRKSLQKPSKNSQFAILSGAAPPLSKTDKTLWHIDHWCLLHRFRAPQLVLKKKEDIGLTPGPIMGGNHPEKATGKAFWHDLAHGCTVTETTFHTEWAHPWGFWDSPSAQPWGGGRFGGPTFWGFGSQKLLGALKT